MKRSHFSCLLLLALCVGNGEAKGENAVKGEIFELSHSPTKPLFFYENSRKTGEEGKSTAVTRYTDVDGKLVVEEETHYENGKLTRYTYHQHQVDEKGTIEIKEGKVHFSFIARGKTETDTETHEENSIVPDMIEDTIQANWAKLMAGDSIRVRFLLLERQDSIGFKFFKDGERDYKGKVAVDFIMKPSSIFIAAIAPSIRLTVEKDAPHRLLESNGRLPVRISKKNPPESRKDWKAIDGLLVFNRNPIQNPQSE